MKKFIFIYIIQILFGWNANAQSYEKFIIETINLETKEAVPYVHAVIIGTSSGSVGNGDGKIQFSISESMGNEEIKLSAVGFKTLIVKVSSLKSVTKLYLAPDVISLQEVQVKYVDQAKELIKKAINNIPLNYPLETHLLKGFYREAAYAESEYTTPYYQLEASFLNRKTSYADEKDKGQVKLIKGRIRKTLLNDSLFVKFYSGPHLLHRFDYVKERLSPLSLKNVAKGDFEILDTLKYDGQALFEIGYRKLGGKKWHKKIYIEDGSYAITKIESFGLNTKENLLERYLEAHKRISNSAVIEYAKQDSVWRINRVKYETGFQKDNSNRQVYYDTEYIVTEFKIEKIDNFSYGEKFFYGDITYDHISIADTNYWDNQSVIIPYKEQPNLFQENHGFTVVDESSAFDKKIEKIKRFNSDIAFGGRFFNYPSKNISFNSEGLSVNEQDYKGRGFSYLLISNLSYRLVRNWFVDIHTSGSFNANEYSDFSLGIYHKADLLKSGRPLFLSSGIYFGHSWYNSKVSTLEGNSAIVINGKEFNGSAIDVFSTSREFNVIPSLALGTEMTPRWKVYVKLNYFLHIYRTEGLFFKENDGFFKTQSFVKQSSSNFSNIDNPLFSNYSIMIGVGYSL